MPDSAAEVPAVSEADDYQRESRQWLENVYQGDRVRQLSARSIISGMLIGAVMSISNLYVGLQTGWGLGVTITACIVAYAVFTALEAVVPRWREDRFTILENYTMSSAASAAGYMSSAGLVSAIPALYMTTRTELNWWQMMSWLASVSVLGVFMAVPLKRQLINIEKLPFPTGIATAETLRSMHTAGAAAVRKARSLFIAAAVGGLVALWRDGLSPIADWLARTFNDERLSQVGMWALPEQLPLLPTAAARRWAEHRGIGFEGSAVMVAAGAIMGIRVGVSLLIGVIFYYGFLAHYVIRQGWVPDDSFKDLTRWMLWPSTALLLSSGLMNLALRWRTVGRAFQGLAAVIGRSGDGDDPLAHIEVPGSWFVGGTLVSGASCVLLGHYVFGIHWWIGIVAVLLSFLLSIVAARATGETDITPIGAMGKITQLMYGAVAPTPNINANLMTASITAGAASHSADLLTDLKTGYLLGGNPRQQTISQLFGVLAGTLVCVPVYALVVDPEKLGTPELPAPSARIWAAVAELLSEGFKALPPGTRGAMAVAAVVGVLLTLAEEWLPKRARAWVPSPTGLGIAGVVPGYNSISMFLGAAFAWLLSKASPKTDEEYTIPVSSGLIAGESLVALSIKFCDALPGLYDSLHAALRAAWPS